MRLITVAIHTYDRAIELKNLLEKEGIEAEASELAMVPDNYVKLEGDAAQTMQHLTDELEELDDVQEVYTNAELPDGIFRRTCSYTRKRPALSVAHHRASRDIHANAFTFQRKIALYTCTC